LSSFLALDKPHRGPAIARKDSVFFPFDESILMLFKYLGFARSLASLELSVVRFLRLIGGRAVEDLFEVWNGALLEA